MFLALPVTPALAATHYGSNAYTTDRLPWQHGGSYGLTQGYNEGDHVGTLQQYSLDFGIPTHTAVLAVTEGYACWNSGSGLGTFVVEKTAPAAGSGRSGNDFLFFGHNEDSWVSNCANGWTYVYEGQRLAWSDNTGTSTGPHIHITLQNPGDICYCGSSISLPWMPLSGLNPGAFGGQDPPVEYFVGDNVMPGDDNTIGQPGHSDVIFSAWQSQGGVGVVGVPLDNGGGAGVHLWGPGLVQDFADPASFGIVMQYYGAPVGYWVHGAIRDAYFSQFGGYASLGYPMSNEYSWGVYRRSDFQNGSICASPVYGTSLCNSLDTDGDNCHDFKEFGAGHASGGQRDPYNQYDFYDVPVPALRDNPAGHRDGAVGVTTDVVALLKYSGITSSNPVYTDDRDGNGVADGLQYDRFTSSDPAMPWRSGPPDGGIGQTTDLVAMLAQSGDNCN